MLLIILPNFKVAREMELLNQSGNTNITRTFQHSIFVENKSCSEIKLCNPKAPSGSYVIDPDGEGGVTPAQFTDKKNIGVTVISHDSEDRTLVQGCDPKGCYQRDIHYTGANFLQLGNLTTTSAHCEQFIKFECHRAMLLYNGHMFGWWLSRDGDKITYLYLQVRMRSYWHVRRHRIWIQLR